MFYCNCCKRCRILNCFIALASFCTLWKHQKTYVYTSWKRFLTISGGIKLFFWYFQEVWKGTREVKWLRIKSKLVLQKLIFQLLSILHKKRDFSFNFFSKCVQICRKDANLLTFTEEILYGNFFFFFVHLRKENQLIVRWWQIFSKFRFNIWGCYFVNLT